ncbi:MAG TPA: hypothetical protein VMT18_03545 [Planctomycetota bacterium]|nr:hypothetical protein [Planctomycetota bacterium]
MTGPLVWSLGAAAAVKSLDGWIVEALIDLEHLRVQPVGPRLDLKVERIEHARAETRRTRRSLLPARSILPVCEWKLSIDGVSEWELDIADDCAELMVKEVVGGAAEFRIEGVYGRMSVRGLDLRAQAQLLGETELEAVCCLGFQYFRKRL